MKAVVAAFNQEKALVGAFSVITNLRMELFEALVDTHSRDQRLQTDCFSHGHPQRHGDLVVPQPRDRPRGPRQELPGARPGPALAAGGGAALGQVLRRLQLPRGEHPRVRQPQPGARDGAGAHHHPAGRAGQGG